MNYSVHGSKILAGGRELQLFGINFFGFETPNLVIHGLWAVSLESILDQIKSLGFNALRIPFCADVLRNLPISGINLDLNPGFKNRGSLEALDMVIGALEYRGMRYILDHHVVPPSNSITELWYSSGYSENQWIEDLKFMANRHAGKPGFVGIDLKNEPHGSARWGGDQAINWPAAASRAVQALYELNKDILFFIEGVENFDGGSSWWGGHIGDLGLINSGAAASKIVYAPHVYGPSVYMQPYFADGSFPENLPPLWEADWGRLAGSVVLCPTEWGGRYEGKDRVWADRLVDYLLSKGITSNFHWCVNPNSGDTGGILLDDWKTVNVDKMRMIARLRTPLATLTSDSPGPAPTPVPDPKPTPVPTPEPQPPVKGGFKAGDVASLKSNPNLKFTVAEVTGDQAVVFGVSGEYLFKADIPLICLS